MPECASRRIPPGQFAVGSMGRAPTRFAESTGQITAIRLEPPAASSTAPAVPPSCVTMRCRDRAARHARLAGQPANVIVVPGGS